MIYTAGYAGHTAQQLKERAEALNALVVDIRYSPWSYRPEWRKHALAELLPDRYLCIKDWGNRNYNQEAEIELVDYDQGKVCFMRRMLASNADNAILLCGCEVYETCHRSVVADMLRAEGETVEELDW